MEWGNTITLGNIDSTTFEISSPPSCIFTANLSGLQANTKYYYQVITGNSISAMFDFYTPANNTDEESIPPLKETPILLSVLNLSSHEF